MKAEEPGSHIPIVKYGMGASEQHKIVERHFAVAQEERAISAFHVAYALYMAPFLRALIDRDEGQEAAPSPPAPSVVIEADVLVPADLRQSLGLS